jgi:hypothetical protein
MMGKQRDISTQLLVLPEVQLRGDLDTIMVNDFASKLREMTNDGILSCSRIVTFARK